MFEFDNYEFEQESEQCLIEQDGEMGKELRKIQPGSLPGLDSDSRFKCGIRGKRGNSTNKGMNGERVKFMGHQGKSKESVVAGTRESGDQRGKQAPEDAGGRQPGVLDVKLGSAVKGCTRDLGQPPALPAQGREENVGPQGRQWCGTCSVNQALEIPCHPVEPQQLLQAASIHISWGLLAGATGLQLPEDSTPSGQIFSTSLGRGAP